MTAQGPYTVGRAEGCTVRLDNPKVSSLHAKLSFDNANAIIEDLSSNGTFVNGIKVGKGRLRILHHLDQISFLAPAVAEASVDPNACRLTFHSLAAAEASADAESCTASAAAATGPADTVPAGSGSGPGGGGGAASSSSSSAVPAPSDAALEKELTCGICQDLMYRPVALQPCMHNFCGSCFAQWMKRKAECPQCRQSVRVVSRNHAVMAIVEGFVAQHPGKARDPAEKASLDALDTIGNEPRSLRKRDRDDGADLGELSADGSDSDDYSGSDDYDDGYGGLMPAAMMAALGSSPPFGAIAMTPCAQCTNSAPAFSMSPLSGKRPFALPPRALGNGFECEVLKNFIASRGMGIGDLFQECLRKATAGELTLEPVVPGRIIDPAGPTCRQCFDKIFSSLAYQYRAAIPNASLPEAVTQRTNCWYGNGCRTQQHNRQHAARLNHICQPSRGPGSGGDGRGGGRGRGGRGGGVGVRGGGGTGTGTDAGTGAGPSIDADGGGGVGGGSVDAAPAVDPS
jgi:E3 ubiquitin-protein ligase CHFR